MPRSISGERRTRARARAHSATTARAAAGLKVSSGIPSAATAVTSPLAMTPTLCTDFTATTNPKSQSALL